MATIRKRGDNWQVQVRRQGRTLSKTFLRRLDAIRWANQIEVSIDQSGLPSDTGSLKRLSIADIIIRYRDTVCPKRRGGKNETYALNAFLREATSWEYERDWLLTNMNGWRVGDDDWGPIDIGPQLNEQQTLSISKGVRAKFKLLGFDLGGLKDQPRRKPSLLVPRSCSPPNISSQP